MEDDLMPPRAPEVPPGRFLQRKEQVMTAFTRLHPAPRRRRLRLVALVVVPALLVLSTVGAATYARLRHEPITILESGVGCFDKLSREADTAVVDLKGLDPIARCREVWESLGRKAPPLIACVYPTGALGVFPGRDPADCAKVDLAAPAPGEVERLVKFDAFKQALISRINMKVEPPDCLGARQAQAVVRAELRKAGLTGWKIELVLDSFSGNQPCALAHADSKAMTVTLDGQWSGLFLALAPMTNQAKCFTPEEAEALTRRALVSRGLSDWTVQRQQGSWTADQPCTSYRPDTARHVITLHGSSDGRRFVSGG